MYYLLFNRFWFQNWIRTRKVTEPSDKRALDAVIVSRDRFLTAYNESGRSHKKTNISLGMQIIKPVLSALPGKHISFFVSSDMCSPTWAKHITCEMCSPTWETHIPSDMCSPIWETHIPSDMCSTTWETHIPSDLCSPNWETDIPSNMCFPT